MQEGFISTFEFHFGRFSFRLSLTHTFHENQMRVNVAKEEERTKVLMEEGTTIRGFNWQRMGIEMQFFSPFGDLSENSFPFSAITFFRSKRETPSLGAPNCRRETLKKNISFYFEKERRQMF